MSGIIAGAGSSQPSNMVWLDWQIPTFTVASGATGNNFEITNSRKTVSLNSTYNADVANTTVNALESSIVTGSSIVTTNTTDVTSLILQFSLDNGVTWTSATNGTLLTYTHLAANKTQTISNNLTLVQCATSAAALTNNSLLLRLIINDATSPTTDAFTIAPTRVTMLAAISLK